MAASVEAKTYQEVKAWIAKQEAYEAEHKQPAPLTNAQRKALEALRVPATASTPPALDDVNYVGKLKEYRDEHPHMKDPAYAGEISGVLPGGTTGRICRVTISQALSHGAGPISSFPAAGGFGIDDATGSPPIFTTKKAAKQFAAKCAIDWLVAQGLMQPYARATNGSAHLDSGAGADVDGDGDGDGAADTLKRPLSLGSGITSVVSSQPAKRQSETQETLGGPSDSSEGDSPVSEDVGGEQSGVPASVPATQLVPLLCKRLGIEAPEYKLEPSPSGVPVLFDGYAAFKDYGDDEIIALREGSVVEGVVGRPRAKLAVAEKLVDLLKHLLAKRDAQFRAILEKHGLSTEAEGVRL